MMIYDSTTLAFAQKAEGMVREILHDIGITVRRTRFLVGSMLYPINVVVFEGRELGHFNGPYLQIGLNKKLIYLAKDSVLRDILRHELAHYLTYIKHGAVAHHGEEFKQVCAEYGISQEIAAATIDLDLANDSKEGDLNSERVLEKVKKLLQLAQSANVHEAEMATIKANELLLRHNIDRLTEKDEPIYLDRVLIQSRKDSKLCAIQEILRHFVVKAVMSMGKNSCCLEVSGSHTNVRLARYVAEFLNRELDHLWETTRNEYGLSGLRAKNSFFTGVARGFNLKMTESKLLFSESDRKALVVVEKKLQIDTRNIYRRLVMNSSGARIDETARNLGVEKGQNLTIRNAVEGKSNNLFITQGN
ncbi:MAG TPA: DUF2786 domain-containing protein [Bacteriovoracaceae bacterium]|nr:DUF2786 domain-containing protein [Bacteriovoracaceae bacterium]